MKTKFTACVLLVFALTCFMSSVGFADVMIKQVTKTDAFTMMGQTEPAKNETSTMWFSKDAARMDQADTSSWIVLPDEKIIYALNHKAKTYSELPLSGVSGVSAMPPGMTEGMSPEKAAKMKEMMGGMMSSMMKMDVTVTPTDETKKINEWDCKKYIVDMKMGMGNTKTETWATEDIDVDMNLFYAISKIFMSMMPGYESIVDEMKKIKGVSILSIGESNMMGSKVTTSTEVVEVKTGDAPKGSFVIPEGYKKAEH